MAKAPKVLGICLLTLALSARAMPLAAAEEHWTPDASHVAGKRPDDVVSALKSLGGLLKRKLQLGAHSEPDGASPPPVEPPPPADEGLEGEDCSLQVGDHRAIDTRDSGAGLSAQYLLTRKEAAPDGKPAYEVTLHPRLFERVASGVPSIESANLCLAHLSERLSGPAGQHLSIRFGSGAESASLPLQEGEPPHWREITAFRDGTGDGFGTFGERCAQLAHGIFHLLGLPDVAAGKTNAKSCAASVSKLTLLSSGRDTQGSLGFLTDLFDRYYVHECSCGDLPAVDALTCQGELRQLSVKPMRCPLHATEREQILATTLFFDTMKLEEVQRYQASYRDNLLNLPELDAKGILAADAGSYSFTQLVRGDRTRGSLLLPAQFNAIVFPGCSAKNSLFYSCTKGSYDETCPVRPASCTDEASWTGLAPQPDPASFPTRFDRDAEFPEFQFPSVLRAGQKIPYEWALDSRKEAKQDGDLDAANRPFEPNELAKTVYVACNQGDLRLSVDVKRLSAAQPRQHFIACPASGEQMSFNFAQKTLPAFAACAREADRHFRAFNHQPEFTGPATPVEVLHLGIFNPRSVRGATGDSQHTFGEAIDISGVRVNGAYYDVELALRAYRDPGLVTKSPQTYAARATEWAEFWHAWRICLSSRPIVSQMADYRNDQGFRPDSTHLNHIHTE